MLGIVVVLRNAVPVYPKVSKTKIPHGFQRIFDNHRSFVENCVIRRALWVWRTAPYVTQGHKLWILGCRNDLSFDTIDQSQSRNLNTLLKVTSARPRMMVAIKVNP